MGYRRPSSYPYPGEFRNVKDVEDYTKRMYAALLENDSRAEYVGDRSPEKNLKELIVRPEWYGAVGDGVTDDTTAIQAAIDRAKSSCGTVVFSAKTYRVTSGYTNDTRYDDVSLVGMGPSRNIVTSQGTIILLDSSDSDSFFYRHAARHSLYVSGITFKCNQYVLDRKFFRFSPEYLVTFYFHSVNFEDVEKPLVFEEGVYLQSCALRDVQFRDSGTIHSEATSIAGTLLVLDNVNHEGSVPANTDKILCDLSWIRSIQATNLLLEGTFPAAGWTVLKILSDATIAWAAAPTATLHGFWTEWNDPQPTYSVDQTAGRVTIHNGRGDGIVSDDVKYKISSSGIVTFYDTSFASYASPELTNRFELEDYTCHVIFNRCSTRDTKYSLIETDNPSFAFNDCSMSRPGETPLSATIYSTSASTLCYKWDGGYADGESLDISLYGGTTYTPSVDTTHGRKLLFVPNGNVINATIQIKPRDVVKQYGQYWIVFKAKLPTFTGGELMFGAYDDLVNAAHVLSCTTALSAQDISVALPVRTTAASPSLVGLGVSYSSLTGVSGNLEIYSFAIYYGNSAPPAEYPNYPKNIVTHNTAAPSAGAWKKGDIIWNSAPSVGSAPGWQCTTAGTPGTWTAIPYVGYVDQDVRSAASPTFNGLYVSGEGIKTYNADVGTYGGYHYTGVLGTRGHLSGTGTMQIKMPKDWTNTIVWTKIVGYDYSAGKSIWEVLVGGYSYAVTPQWLNVGATIRGKAPFSSVRLARTSDGNRLVVLLGGMTTVWGESYIVVSDVYTWYAAHDSGWGTNWDIEILADEDDITHSQSTDPTTVSVYTGTAPSSSPADLFQMYSADIAAGNAAPHFRTENGKIVKLYQQVLTAGLEEAYETPELDSEAKIIAAINATNAKVNDLIEALHNTGLLASS